MPPTLDTQDPATAVASDSALRMWPPFLLIASLLLEVQTVTGGLSVDVILEVQRGLALWWLAPIWIHTLTAGLVVLLLRSTTSIVLNRDAAGWALIAAVVLGSHLSPLYRGGHIWPLFGVALALAATVVARRLAGGGGEQASASFSFSSSSRALWPQGLVPRLVAVVIVIVVGLTYFEQFREMERVVSQPTDFGTFYLAARALAEGADPYAVQDGGYFYPPVFAAALRLFLWLPVAGASLLWFTLKLAMVVWTINNVFRWLAGSSMEEATRPWFLLGVSFVAARFLLSDLQYGNTNTFVLWLLVVAVLQDLEDRPGGAGLALAGAIALKVVPVLFVPYFLVRRRWKLLAWTCVGLVGLALLPLIVSGSAGIDAWGQYFQTSEAKLDTRLDQPDNQSLWGALNRTFPSVSLEQLRVVWAVLAVGLIGFATWLAWRLRNGSVRQCLASASLFFLAGLLVSPGTWVVHYVAVLLPMACVLREAIAGTRWLWPVFIVANLMLTVSGWLPGTVAPSIEGSWFVLAALMLFASVLVAQLRQKSVARAKS